MIKIRGAHPFMRQVADPVNAQPLVWRAIPLFFFVFLLFSGCQDGTGKPPVACRGVLDLSGWRLDVSGPVFLAGEWELYWNRLLIPEDFATSPGPEQDGWANLSPDASALQSPGAGGGQTGYATLRLRIMPGPGGREYAVRLFNVKSACTLWINGVLASENGIPGLSAETEIPFPSVSIHAVPADASPIELLLQISNHHYRDTWLNPSLQVGPAQTLWDQQARDWGLAAFFAGTLVVMGLYHLVLFLWRKKSASMLFFGLYCLLWLGCYIFSDSSAWLFRLYVPQAKALWMDKAAMVCFYMSIPVGYRFLHSLYPLEFSRRILAFSVLLAAVFSLLAFFAPPLVFSRSQPVYYAVSCLLIGNCLFLLSKARAHGREGAGLLLAGFFILGISGINDMLSDMQLIRSVTLIPVGMLTFILFQSFVLARQFSKTFASVENLSVELERNNTALQTEMAENSRLAAEIVTVCEDERRRMSHDLHDGLCQQLTGARLRCSVLEAAPGRSAEDSRELSALSALLETAVSHAYDLSRGLWPAEHAPQDGGAPLEELARRVRETSGIAVEIARNMACAACSNPHAAQVYRIAQEALANAVKHSGARKISISLSCGEDRRLTLVVCDDGVGRRNAVRSGHGGLGTRIMACRAKMMGAEFAVEDVRTGGTMVRCSLACVSKSAAAPGLGAATL